MQPVRTLALAPTAATAATAAIIARTLPERVLIRMSGDIDAARLDEARGALAAVEAAKPGLPVVLDAHRVTFMDSTGVAFVGAVRRTCLATRAPVHLVDPPATVTSVLALAGLEHAVPTLRTAGLDARG
ncbi:MAG: hypothetical protein K0S43_718 [Cellulosimicrobium sp.]|nr:hypothetical protein [Cellulosimicrobium sp.]